MVNNITALNANIYKDAQAFGACKERGLDVILSSKKNDDLIKLLKSPHGIEFCMDKKFPSIQILKPYDKILQAQNVFISGDHFVSNTRLILAFGGEINITIDGYNVCEVYATNNAVINVKAKDNAFVSVELHHGAKATSLVKGAANVKVYRK